MSDDDKSEREAFEAWFFADAPRTASERMGDGYRYMPASQAWKAWQAALAAAPAQAEPEKFDTWMGNPYTKVLMKSLEEDYVPRGAAPQPAQAEPVAWAVFTDEGLVRLWSTVNEDVTVLARKWGRPVTALYAAPQPAPEAQPLTDEQIDAVTDAQWGKGCAPNQYMAHRAAARAYIRAALAAAKEQAK